MPKSSARTITAKEKAKNARCRLKSKIGGALLLSAFALLSGCVERGVVDAASGEIKYESPDRKVNDYSRVRCDGDIWKSQNDETNANGLYWLRLISCAGTFTPTQARAQSYGYDGTKWDGVFKRAILLSKLDLGNAERRGALEQLKNFQATYPDSVYSLVQMWRSEQQLQLGLQEERARAQRQKEGAESQIVDLQLQMVEIKHQLHETTRKLQNLTDIERQLSSRKLTQGESLPPVNALPPQNPNAGSAVNEPKPQPVEAAAPKVDEKVEEKAAQPAKAPQEPAVAEPKAEIKSSGASTETKQPEKPAAAAPESKPAPKSETKVEKPAQPAQSQPAQSEAAPAAQKP
ncbi:membrane protein [Leminorella grimontii]|uniref:Membrane protein n=1 Tax=Leminorella grimontii TaxID=82981 RepID=A0AAV5N0K6_9GAMM|nr:hypothetical protein [Leminorella grimontii]KFC97460.1 putative alpha helix protein [Leminorella grimontii ATCC 33999 = DSM 5078]GKX55179.1 membrane protein [Leminorella grimontii]VFS56797.1 Quorum-sensing regulator protein G precursor [Leminorella grimontii]